MTSLFCINIKFTVISIHTVRLAGGRSYNQGRVEVYYNGEWGTVCNNGWDYTEASVVCRHLGLGMLGNALSSAYYNNTASSYVFLDNVMCSLNDTTLTACDHYGVGITYFCSPNDNAGVVCAGMLQSKVCMIFTFDEQYRQSH